MNYADMFAEGEVNNYVSYMNNSYINLYSPTVKIFKLDKIATNLDKLYGEEMSARVYLPPFEIRMYHLDNAYKQVLGEGTMPYLETQEEITFVCNFDNMVKKIRSLKNKHTSDILLEYNGNKKAYCSNLNNIFTINVDGINILKADLKSSTYNTSFKLVNEINTFPNLSAVLTGDNDLSVDIVDFNETIFKSLSFFTIDNTYRNITDIIEQGDLILTNKWKLYEVHTNMPGGDFGWDYATFILQGNLRSIKDKAALPDNYVSQIQKHEYNLRQRINME